MVGETVVIRGLAAAAAAAAVVGAVLMRRWDRSAGKRVAQLTAARVRDEWKTEERIAELESELEEARAIRAKLEGKLRGKRAELARLRTEHADLLRRYATAETERASALEGRRVARGSVPRPARALESTAPAGTPGSIVAAAAYRKAAEALRDLERNAALQQAEADAEAAEEAGEDGEGTVATDGAATAAPDTFRPSGAARAAAVTDATAAVTDATAAVTDATADAAVETPAADAAKPVVTQKTSGTGEASGTDGTAEAGKSADAGKTSAKDRTSATDSAIATDKAPKAVGPAAVPAGPKAAVPQQPAARRRASRAQGGFDFFGTQQPLPPRPVEETDLADVVGEEALAEVEAGADTEAEGDVIDLTAHDETEQIDIAELRTAIS
ncbi:hypothetical protein [Streptomyces albireticuli]|uniref:hypothetical protein n=1 Tax=Streptomyces albireticuli TaxID=1940 RepID=UPI0027E2539E|nr:hypothetical protein [Streptomyces albireticuli]